MFIRYFSINIFLIFILNKFVTFADKVKDPCWMAEKLEENMKWKHKVYRGYLKSGKTQSDYMYVHHAITEVSQLISESEDKYILQ